MGGTAERQAATGQTSSGTLSRFLLWFLGALVVFGAWLAYDTFMAALPAPAGTRAKPSATARPPRPPQAAIASSIVVVPAADAATRQAVPPPPNPDGPRVWHGARVVHAREGKGYSRRSVDDWRARGEPEPSPEYVNVWGPSLLPASNTAPASALPAESLRAARALGTATQPAGEIRLWRNEHPYVETYDAAGNVHRLFLDHNEHLFYRAPDGAITGLDEWHRVAAFNLRVDLAGQIHGAWFARDNGQLYYCWLIPAGDTVIVHYRDFIAKAPEPSFIEIVPMPDAIKITFGDAAGAAFVKVSTDDPTVHATGRSG